MFKTYFLLARGGDPFAFQGDAAASAVVSRFPDACGYYQTRARPGQEEASFSATAELWFRDPVSAMAAGQAGPGELITTEATVHSVLVGMERVVMQVPSYIGSARVKGVYPFRRKADMDVDSFQSYWWHHHGPIAALTEEALSYHQVHPLPGSYNELPVYYDGITEITWPDAETAGRALVSRQMTEDQGSDAPNFVDLESIALFLAEEEILIAP